MIIQQPTPNFRLAQKIITNCTGNGEFREWESLDPREHGPVLQQLWLGSDGSEEWKDIPTVMAGGFPPLKDGEQDPPYRSRMNRP